MCSKQMDAFFVFVVFQSFCKEQIMGFLSN